MLDVVCKGRLNFAAAQETEAKQTGTEQYKGCRLRNLLKIAARAERDYDPSYIALFGPIRE